MATYYSNVYLGASPRAEGSECGEIAIVGKLTYPADVAPATGDVLKLCRVPINAHIVEFRLWYADWGGTVTTDFGLETADPNAFVSGAALGTAQNTTGHCYLNQTDGGTSTEHTAFATATVVTTAADNVIGTITTGTTGTAGSSLTFFLKYIDLGNPTAGTVAYTWNGLAAGL